jgi:hypothetical protein
MVSVAQEPDARFTIFPVKLPQGFVLESLNGLGTTNCTIQTVSGIGSGNPAGLCDFQRPSVGIGGQIETDIQPAWLAGIGYRRGRPFLPQSAGLAVPAGDWRIGIGFSQRYNAVMDFGDMEVTTVEDPDGTGQTFSASDQVDVLSLSVLCGRSVFAQGHGRLQAGGRFSVDRLSMVSKIFQASACAVDYAVSWAAGFRYDLGVDSALSVKLGLFFERGACFRTEAAYSKLDLMQPVEVIGETGPVDVQPMHWPVVANMPSAVHAGVTIGSEESAFVTFDYTESFVRSADGWPIPGKGIAGSAVGRPVPPLTVSVGFYSLETEPLFRGLGFDEKWSALFWTAGCMVRLSSFAIGTAFAGSKNSETHPWFRRTLAKLTMAYHL